MQEEQVFPLLEIAGVITRKVYKSPLANDSIILQEFTDAHEDNLQLVEQIMDPVWLDEQMESQNKYNKAAKLRSIYEKLFSQLEGR